jgi:hypothetical protein
MGLKDGFKNPTIAYRGAPFWSWNDDLDPEELKRQVREMKDKGLGGAFMHARVGLITPYLSDEWMECIKATVEESKRVGFGAWLYDEDCWPSGSAGGKVSGVPGFSAKSLRCDEIKPEELKSALEDEATLKVFAAVKEEGKLYRIEEVKSPDGDFEGKILLRFWVQPTGYVDLMDDRVMEAFIESTYEAYAREVGDEFGRTVPGIFTDEPNWHHVPWTPIFPEYFRERRGYDILEKLPAIFFEVEDYNYHKVRFDFWSTMTDRYVESFSQRLYDWCEEHNLIFTGHQLCEDNLLIQIQHIGAAMPHYEFMQMPGIDHLGRRIADPILPKQVSSVAHQMNGRRVLSEMFGVSGWSVTMEQLKWIAEWQFVLGIDFVCQHLSLYSMRGCRKRDYPPSLHYQMPWWPFYNMLNDLFARETYLLTQGRFVADILLLHPIGSAWTIYDPSSGGRVMELNGEFVKVSENLLKIHRDYDYGDERIILRHGKVKGDKFVVGSMEYSTVILPPSISWRRNTIKLLAEFVKNGGKLIAIRPLPTMQEGEPLELPSDLEDCITVIDNDLQQLKAALPGEPSIVILDERGEDADTIYYQERDVGVRELFFTVNTSTDKAVEATVKLKGYGLVERWDCQTGEVEKLPAQVEDGYMVVKLRYEPMGSHMLALNTAEEPIIGRPKEERVVQMLDLSRTWKIALNDPNALTLDYCRYRVLGEGDWSARMPVWRVLRNHLSRLKRCADIALLYEFEVEKVPEGPIYLAVEVPEAFDIFVNDQPVKYEDIGWWVDIAFRKVDITRMIKEGTNRVEMHCHFVGDKESHIRRLTPPARAEERKQLRFGTELESIYVIGDFGVWQKDEPQEPGRFVIGEIPASTEVGDLVKQGLPFYCGSVTLTQRVDFVPEGERTYLDFDGINAVVADVRVNGKPAGRVVWRPYRVDVTELLAEGENFIEITLYNSPRNLLGPHHHKAGDLYAVGPGSWSDENNWVEEYNFVPFGFPGAVKLISIE